MTLEGEFLFGSRARTVALEETAKACYPLTASSIARARGLDLKTIYREFSRLSEIGIFSPVLIAKNQTGYVFSQSESAMKLRDFIITYRKSREVTYIDKIRESLPSSDYVISLPLALSIPYDVFYVPTYLMVFVTSRYRTNIQQLLEDMGSDSSRIYVFFESLRGRIQRYDDQLRVPLATNEQAIADGLNYFPIIKDREIIRTLISRFDELDLDAIARKLKGEGMKRFMLTLMAKGVVEGKSYVSTYKWAKKFGQQYRKTKFANDDDFGNALIEEVIPLVLSNDQLDDKLRFREAVKQIHRILNKNEAR